MRNLHDTQPSRSLYLKPREQSLSAPPRILFWGVIVFFALVLLGIAGVVVGFREILRPAQQQRVIDQLPFMRMLRRPTPQGGVFPTLAPPASADDALALLDMPLDFATPMGAEDEVVVVALPTLSPTPVPPTSTAAPTITAEPSATIAEAEHSSAAKSEPCSCASYCRPIGPECRRRPQPGFRVFDISSKPGTTVARPRLPWR